MVPTTRLEHAPGAEAGDARRAVEQLEEERRHLVLSLELTAALARAHTRADMARTIFEKGLAAFRADAGVLALAQGDEVELYESFGYPSPLIDGWRRFPLSLSSPITDAIRLGAPVWVGSAAEASARFPEWAPAVLPLVDRAWAALPLAARGVTFGALGFSYHSDQRFDPPHRDLMVSVAERCAQALERAHLYDQAVRSDEEARQRAADLRAELEARRWAEEALRVAEERLRLAQEAAGVGIHDFDPVTGIIHWDERVRRLWGVGERETVTYDLFLRGLHPDDRAATQAAVTRALDPRGGGEYHAEYRVRSLADGIERWVVATGRVAFEEGRAVRLVGTVQDVTAAKHAEQALRESEERLRQTLRHAAAGVFSWDIVTGAVEWSPENLDLYGVEPGTPLEQATWESRIHPEDLAHVRDARAAALEGRTDEYRAEFRLAHPQLGTRWLLGVGRVQRDAAGRPVRLRGLNLDITDRKLAEEEVRRADRRKSDFLAVLAHELRSPLAAIRSGVHVWERSDPSSDTALRARGIIRRQAEQLARLVDDLLDVSRIAHGKIDLDRRRLDLREVVRRACDDAREEFDRRRVALRWDDLDEPAWIEGDPARLAQVLGNLLGNALKFTPAGGRVEVRLDHFADRCALAIRDTGCGVAADDLERIFDRFAQAERTRERAHGGLGLGLALVRELVALHGGSVRAASPGVGQGTEFVVVLPLVAQPGTSGA